jgi:serine phosphatase RsbU (regulator of sigma subunit)
LARPLDGPLPRVASMGPCSETGPPPSGQIIGGDWSDLVPLPDGRSVLIVGDAMGHGPEAAAVMAQLRAAANALAGLDCRPGLSCGGWTRWRRG